jgi:4-hydroxy-3-polyprenylbenzoate decarboxylase
MGGLVVGISGATGVIYGVRMLRALAACNVETHLVVTQSALRNLAVETEYTEAQVKAMASRVYDVDDVGAAIASGSFKVDGMVVIPCSMKTLSAVANSYNDNLLVRAADVTLKERRRLVLVVRETPLHEGHLRLMVRVARMGGVIMPPVPAFYHMPKTIEDLIDQTVGKALDLFSIDAHLFKRWGTAGNEAAVPAAGKTGGGAEKAGAGRRKKKRLKVEGRVVKGLGESASFLSIPWVNNQLLEKLSFSPYCGTLNIDVGDPAVQEALKKGNGSRRIVPGEKGFCEALLVEGVVAGRYPCGVILPLMADYPTTILEIVAPVHLKETLGIVDGDKVEVDLYP